ncbi:MAG: RNA-binding transcriptional accessory protein [Bacteroidales bacterium]|nr:RNA-binding transcriptional accessory protein [Bacteroidales bacterium]
MTNIASKIAQETNLAVDHVNGVLNLLDEGATIPFIARYRKEKTGDLNEEQITSIRDIRKKQEYLDSRRKAVLKNIGEQEKLNDELRLKIEQAKTLSELEDLYLPYKGKRQTRAGKAIERGLEPLAAMIMSQKYENPEQVARPFVNPDKNIDNIEGALEGASDIIAAWINERISARNRIRKLFWREGAIIAKLSKSTKNTETADRYRDYFDYSEQIRKLPSHRYLAIIRGEKEDVLNVKLNIDNDRAVKDIERLFISTEGRSAELIKEAMNDALKRLMLPSLESEIRTVLKERSDDKAIDIFKSNLYQLLMAPPLGGKRVLAIDPGFRTGCKIVCLDEHGNLMENDNIYPHPPQQETTLAAKKIRSLVDAYNIEAIAIGNGTAGRETEIFLQKKVKFNKDIIAVMVNESGASVYSASKIARAEFPGYDVTVRGAVSIGRRLMDPLAELVKIDPKSIGVGQYQHDVDQNKLSQALHDTVKQCVNRVGVEVNTASRELLAYVSGIGPVLAHNIVEYRKSNGAFQSRKELKKIPKLGPKAFEQAAGFLKISNSEQPLDESAVHPESYHIVNKMAQKAGVSAKKLMRNEQVLKKLNPADFVNEKTGILTIRDILKELEKPGRDPRKNIKNFEFDRSLKSIHDVKPGMLIPGQVNNITAFGCFVDIGIKENGLVHVSELADRFVSDPNEVVVLNQYVKVRVLSVNKERKRIQLSLKQVE